MMDMQRGDMHRGYISRLMLLYQRTDYLVRGLKVSNSTIRLKITLWTDIGFILFIIIRPIFILAHVLIGAEKSALVTRMKLHILSRLSNMLKFRRWWISAFCGRLFFFLLLLIVNWVVGHLLPLPLVI